MNPSTASVYAQGQQMAQGFKNQATQYGQQYNTDTTQANQANANLQAYNANMQNPSQMYSQNLGAAQQMYNFNPAALGTATQNLTQMQDAMSQLSQAQQQGTGGYGLTGAQLAGRYASQTAPLQGSINTANNAVGNYTNLVAATQTQAQQQSALGYQGEQLQSQNLQALYTNAVQQQQTAMSQMQFYSNLYQQQGGLTAQQAAQYGAAQASYASAEQSYAQASLYQEQLKEAINQGKGNPSQSPTPTSNLIPGTNTPNNQIYKSPSGQTLGYENPTTHQDVQTVPNPAGKISSYVGPPVAHGRDG